MKDLLSLHEQSFNRITTNNHMVAMNMYMECYGE